MVFHEVDFAGQLSEAVKRFTGGVSILQARSHRNRLDSDVRRPLLTLKGRETEDGGFLV